MSKTRHLLFLFLLVVGVANAQSIISVSPDNGLHGQVMGVTISGQNTHFTQGTNTGNISLPISFTQGTHTLNVMGNSVLSNSTVQAQLLVPGNAPLGNYDLYMYSYQDGALFLPSAFTVNPLSGQLTGTVYSNVPNRDGNRDPLPNLPLKLTGPGVNATTETDANGEFTFTNLDFGAYKLYITEPGYDNSNPPVLNINYQNQVLTDLVFGVDEGQLVFEGALGFPEKGDVLDHWRVYPNPARESIGLSFYSTQPEALQVRLYDINGRFIATLAHGKSTTGLNQFQFDLQAHNLKTGSYLMQVAHGTDYRTLEIIVR